MVQRCSRFELPDVGAMTVLSTSLSVKLAPIVVLVLPGRACQLGAPQVYR